MGTRGPLQTRIGYTFKQGELLELALTHPSTSNEHNKKLATNQRLEFLEMPYYNYLSVPNFTGAFLTMMKDHFPNYALSCQS